MSAQVSSVTKRITAGLGPDCEAVRFFGDGNALHFARCRVDGIDDVIEAAGQPQRLSIDADVTHVGTAATGHGPRLDDLAGGKVDN